MKRNGETDANPRFAQLNAQLMAIQRAQNFKNQQVQLQQHRQQQLQQQQALQQQQQPQQQQPQQVQQPSPAQQQMQQQQQSAQNQQPASVGLQGSPVMNLVQRPAGETNQVNGAPHPAAASHAPKAMTQAQLFLLKHQIIAFRKISKNQPLTEDTQNILFGGPLTAPTPQPAPQPAPEQQQQPPPQQASPVQVVQRSQTPQEQLNLASRMLEQAPPKPASPAPPLISDEPPLLSPHQFFRRKITLAEHSRRDQRPLIPAIFPTGIDIVALQDCHQRAKDNRIVARIQDLEHLNSNIIDFPSAATVESSWHRET